MVLGQQTISFPNIHCVFLDRDGVINRKPPEGEYIHGWPSFRILSGVESAIASLNRSGHLVLVVTNQRGIALGRYSKFDVEMLHNHLQKHLAGHGAHIDAFYYCPHDNDQCSCRKPKTGMFEQAFQEFPDASRSNSILIGDSLSDMEAARTLGLPCIFIQGNPETQKPGGTKAAELASAVSDSLSDAVERYLS